MNLIKKGAEGDLYATTWNGKKSVLKIRQSKKYRNPELDLRLRRQRTVREAEILSQVKSFGVAAPLVFFVDTRKCSITMQFVRGAPAHSMRGARFVGISQKLGRIVGMLHKNGIMHGDLTTSNFMVYGERISVIDFGLAVRTSKPEDHAVDLRLFREILNSAHVDEMERAWRGFLSGYRAVVGSERAERITRLVLEIEARGRYAAVV